MTIPGGLTQAMLPTDARMTGGGCYQSPMRHHSARHTHARNHCKAGDKPTYRTDKRRGGTKGRRA